MRIYLVTDISDGSWVEMVIRTVSCDRYVMLFVRQAEVR